MEGRYVEDIVEENEPPSSPFSCLLKQNVESTVESVSFCFVVRIRTSGVKVNKRGPTAKIHVEVGLPLGDGSTVDGSGSS